LSLGEGNIAGRIEGAEQEGEPKNGLPSGAEQRTAKRMLRETRRREGKGVQKRRRVETGEKNRQRHS